MSNATPTVDQIKVESIAGSYAEYLESGYSSEEAEAIVRKLAPDNGCDSSQIERGIEAGRVWARN